MSQNEKKQVFIMVGVMLVIVVILFTVKVFKGKDKEKEATNNVVKEQFVEKQEDGTKVNTSDKLKETKKLGNLEISDIKLTAKDGESYITAKVKNIGDSKAGDDFVTFTIIDKAGKTLSTNTVYIGTIEAGKEITLSSKTSSDFVNAYDFIVSR